MNALVAKRKGLSVVVVVLILMSLAVPVAMAAPQPPLVLPTTPIPTTYVENNLDDPPYLHISGSLWAIFRGNYSVSPGIQYLGWCVEQGIPLTTAPGHTDTLYSTSPATNLPDNAQFYRDPLTPIVQSTPALLNTPIPWGSLNYLLNHKLGTAKDVQTAIWLLMWGAIPPTFTVTQNVTDMLNAAIANPGFVPATGDTIAVLLYNDGIGHITDTSAVAGNHHRADARLRPGRPAPPSHQRHQPIPPCSLVARVTSFSLDRPCSWAHVWMPSWMVSRTRPQRETIRPWAAPCSATSNAPMMRTASCERQTSIGRTVRAAARSM